MPSAASRYYRSAVRRAGGRNSLLKASQAQAYLDAVRVSPEEARPPRGALRNVSIEHREWNLGNGVKWPMYDLTPVGRSSDGPSILYLHGGAYVGQIGLEAWHFASRVATQSKLRVTVAIYPLVPFVTADRLVDQARQVLAHELGRHGKVIMMGDSAGGGLALSSTMAAREMGEQLPDGLVLISPWTDVAVTGPDVSSRERRDVMLAPAGLRHFGEAFRGELDPQDWRASPLFGDLSALPPMQIFAAEDDVLYSDATRLHKRVKEAGVPDELIVGKRMLHIWPVSDIPEGREAVRDIVRFVTALPPAN